MGIDDFVKQDVQRKLQQNSIYNDNYYTIERNCHVAGLTYHLDEYLDYLDDEEDLVAVFEPNNPYDRNAIAIYGGEHFIGYVPRHIAKKIAPLPNFVKDDLILDLQYRDVERCIYSILIPKKYVTYILDKQGLTFTQMLCKWFGVGVTEFNKTFKLRLAITIFAVFLYCLCFIL